MYCPCVLLESKNIFVVAQCEHRTLSELHARDMFYSSCLYRSSSEVMDGPVPDPPEGFLCRAPTLPAGVDGTGEGSERFGEYEARLALCTGVVGLLVDDFFLF